MTMQWRDGTHFVDALHLRRGYDILGKGAYSTVLAKRDSNRVIKVNRVLDDWLDYVVWAARNGYAGNAAPKIYSYRRIKGSRHDFYVAVVERFESTASEMYDAKPRLVNLSYKVGGYIKGYVSEVELSTLECPSEMVRFARDFSEAFHDAGFDIHSGNWMVRDDGTLVLTDPIAHRGASSPRAPDNMRSRQLAALFAMANGPVAEIIME